MHIQLVRTRHRTLAGVFLVGEPRHKETPSPLKPPNPPNSATTIAQPPVHHDVALLLSHLVSHPLLTSHEAPNLAPTMAPPPVHCSPTANPPWHHHWFSYLSQTPSLPNLLKPLNLPNPQPPPRTTLTLNHHYHHPTHTSLLFWVCSPTATIVANIGKGLVPLLHPLARAVHPPHRMHVRHYSTAIACASFPPRPSPKSQVLLDLS